jgi:hypothetical protein
LGEAWPACVPVRAPRGWAALALQPLLRSDPGMSRPLGDDLLREGKIQNVAASIIRRAF